MNIPLSGGSRSPVRVLSVLCLLLSATALSGCGDEKSKAESEFIRDCKSGGGTTGICGCIYDVLQTKYPHGELLKMNQQYGYVPQGFMNNMLSAAQQCRKQ
ncbi:hypothetical protein HUZ38_17530 [Klebsiella pneumoniae]|uniref:hypothetical protein n=1 Tax=Klebsiella pneumoniae TaxID=573 RepID=UPI000A18B370|nr:hypothetical protein [Klebsiella pneumoniae]EKZ5467993.1 hypothetical protein [Klebsiella quasipneumoniae]BBV78455.1 hypothetical protein STW0522RAO56_45090 [Raoultella planticola]HCQ8126922.1 hypothetical protein [Klebsiella quasipneumoniae subsp. similipneumoniae]EKZ5478797.1 hypothetical protein [Klebsiella quasipneumoniae]EKZ5643518.1 hypothetical protein [Klebsiella quasipneumoniae]